MTSHAKIILLITLLLTVFFSFLPAEEHEDYAVVSLYENSGKSHLYESNRSKTLFKDINVSLTLLKSDDKKINISNINTYIFKPIPKDETFQETNATYWLKVDLGKSYPSGRHIYTYGDAEILEHSIKDIQSPEKFTLDGVSHLTFSYTQGVDPQTYYFKLSPKHYRIPFRFIYVSTPQTFYKYQDRERKIQLLLGLILGLIIMAGLYNAAMYYYNRDISFLYYALMQVFMVLLLHYLSGAYLWEENSLLSRNIFYGDIISLFASLFAIYFTLSFLDAKKYLPKIHTFLLFSATVIIIDMAISIFYKSLIIANNVLPFFMLAFLYAGYKRIRQGYKPAHFYLAGWVVLTVAVFFNTFDIGYDYTIIDPLYIGVAAEAMLFSLALSYKMRMVSKEKEEQKELMVHQSKLASMGEMIGNIAHQWRQPLTHLSYIHMNIKDSQTHDELTSTYLNNKLKEATTLLEFMSQTIDDFQNFHEPYKNKEDFSLVLATKEILEIMNQAFKQNSIETKLIILEDSILHNYKNEYKQVLLNLLSNAKDVLIERVTITPEITIIIEHNKISIEDNAGGIKADVLPRIFEPYYTTKEGNSGIGLYMSKMIVERNMGGTLHVKNIHKGAQLSLNFT